MSRPERVGRRELLLALATSPLAGCCLISKPQPICPFDPAYQNEHSMLTIDVHAHVFNATDLQVRDFITRVSTRQIGGIGRLAEFFGGVLESIGWAAAPDAAEEMEVLGRLKPDILACNSERHVAELQTLRETKYDAAVDELQVEATRRLPVIGASMSSLSRPAAELDPELLGIREILDLPPTYTAFKATVPDSLVGLSDVEIREVTVKSALQFVVEMFQYRFVSVYNYLGTYNAGNEQKIDLLTPALVDYDFWLSRGAATPSSLPDQMRLMREITILSGGRVHALVPYDPFRQVVHGLGSSSGFSPIELVRIAVEEQGAIGVKLYPPMGFAPYGNGALDVWRSADWLGDVAQRSDFPSRLDAAMDTLFEYCGRAAVPVMGHSNHSNGPSDAFEALTGPEYWRQAAEKHDSVNLSFGHFGGAGSTTKGTAPVEEFLQLLLSDHQSGTRRLHADASYFSTMLEDPTRLRSILDAIFHFGPDGSNVAVDRLMYGSDWKMLAAELASETYLNGFASIIQSIEQGTGSGSNLTRKFFGLNAARYFGLMRGSANRRRLERFYDDNDMPEPLWMTKVDAA